MQEEFNPKVCYKEHLVNEILKLTVHQSASYLQSISKAFYVCVVNPHHNPLSYR